VTDLLSLVAPELFPVEHRYLEIDGARLHYVSEGEGETLLLLHGNPAWSFLYRKIIAGLKDDYRCVAPDFPGYGLSTAPPGYGYTPAEHSAILERFVDTLELRDLTIMVQDWGGPIGLGLAGRRPELVRGLIIGNTFAWPLDRDPRIRLFSALMGGPIGRSFTRAFNLVPRFFFWRGFAQPLAPSVRQAYLAPWRDRDRRAPATIGPRQLVHAKAYLRQVENNLPALADRPALVVWGEKDFAFHADAIERFEAAFPNHQTIRYPNASHFLQEDVGDQIADAFKTFRRHRSS
jgi:haloalkane dehalogenase